jgi:hypothetical protein
MPKRAKQNGAGADTFLFTVPIIGPEPCAEEVPWFERPSVDLRARDPLPMEGTQPADGRQRAQRSVDRIVMGTAAGALVLSMPLLRQVAPSPSAQTAWLLGVAWAALLAALVAALVHHHLGQQAHAASRVTDWERTFQAADPYLVRSEAPPHGRLALAASASLVAGLVCLAVFAFLNAGFA